MSLVKDIEAWLIADAAITAVVGTRVFGTQTPDRQTLPRILVERVDEETTRFSVGKLVKSTVAINCWAAGAGDAEALAELVKARMGTHFPSTAPARTVDVKPSNASTQADAERGEGGIIRYVVPLEYTCLRQE